MNEQAPSKDIIELTNESFRQYIALCDGLMNYSVFSYQEKSNWVGSTHGVHIRFVNKNTNQVVEAPYKRMTKTEDLDTFFWFEFVCTTPWFHHIKEYLDKSEMTFNDFIKLFFNSTFLNRPKIEIPEFKVGDFIQLRDSAFQDEFHSKAFWDKKYYYEDQIAYMSWPIEGNFKDVGGTLCTLLGGASARIENIVRENSEIKEIHTELFIILMPYAYETQQFKPISPIENYQSDSRVGNLIEMLSFFELNCRLGEFTPGQRDHNKIIVTQQYFEGMKRTPKNDDNSL